MQDKDKGGSALKKVVNSLDGNRKSIQTGHDISGNIGQARQTFGELESIIKWQTSTIGSLRTFEKSMANQSSRTLELKRFFIGFVDKMKFQISKFMKVGENIFTIRTSKSNKQDDFQKAADELNKMINSIRQQSDTSQKMYTGIYKLIQIRDNIISQFLRIMLYRKNVLWRDLNMKFDDYIHAEVKAMLNKIKQSEQKFGYIPSSLPFKLPKTQTEGDSSIPDLITIVIQDQIQLIQSMKNFSKLSEQPQLIEDISKNQTIVKGLRQKIELLTKNYASLMEKYRSLQISKGKVQLGASQEKSLNQKIQDLQTLVMKKEQDIIELKQISMKSESTIQSLKDKNKELEDEISKWQNLQLPKIKELELAQKTLLQEFYKTKKDFQTYTNLYEAQKQDKIKAYSDLKQQKGRLNEMANILGRQRRKIKQLNSELLRKDQIIMQLVEKAPDP